MEKFNEIKKSVVDALCDGAYLKSIGITDSDQEEVEFCAYIAEFSKKFTDLISGRVLLDKVLDEVMKEYSLYIVTERELENEIIESNNCSPKSTPIKYFSIDEYINACLEHEEETYLYDGKIYRF